MKKHTAGSAREDLLPAVSGWNVVADIQLWSVNSLIVILKNEMEGEYKGELDRILVA